jgi:phosphatidylglycerophosphate synthase
MNRGRLEAFSDGLIAIIRAQGQDSLLKKAVGRDWKGKLSLVLYMVAIATSLGSSWIAGDLCDRCAALVDSGSAHRKTSCQCKRVAIRP